MKLIGRYKKILAMSAAAFGLLGALTLESSMAYFTTYVSAEGGHIVNMGAQTEITEEKGRMSKRVTIQNVSETNDCYIRVKVLCGAPIDFQYSEGDNAALTNWSYNDQDGYYYYGPIVGPKESTTILNVAVKNIPADFDRDTFNVIVLQECTPVLYDDNAQPYADWDYVYSDYQEVPGEGDGN